MADPLVDILVPYLPAQIVKTSEFKETTENYLNKLRSLSIESIKDETEYLEISKEAASKSMASLIFSSSYQLYDSFKSMNKFNAAYDELKQASKDASYECQSLTENRGSLNDENSNLDLNSYIHELKISRNLLQNVDKILDILELPTLLYTCIQSSLYSEALEIISHTKRLGIRYKGIPIFDSILIQIDQAIEEMKLNLFLTLKKNIKLPLAIRTISYLKRLPPYNNSNNNNNNNNNNNKDKNNNKNNNNNNNSATRELQIIYLTLQFAHFKSIINSLEPLKHNSQKYLKRYIESFREYIFQIVASFKSIFYSNNVLENTDNINNNDIAFTPKDNIIGESLVSNFLYNVLCDFKKEINIHKGNIPDRNTRINLWLQVAYCSQSLGRSNAYFWNFMTDEDNYAIPLDEWIEATEKQKELSIKLLSR